MCGCCLVSPIRNEQRFRRGKEIRVLTNRPFSLVLRVALFLAAGSMTSYSCKHQGSHQSRDDRTGEPTDRPGEKSGLGLASNTLWGFWDSGHAGLESRPIEKGNIGTWNRLNTDRDIHLIHMNPAEYNEDFLFNRVNRSLFPDEFFDFSKVEDQDLRKHIENLIEEAKSTLAKKFGDGTSEYHRALKDVESAYIMRGYLAEKWESRIYWRAHVGQRRPRSTTFVKQLSP